MFLHFYFCFYSTDIGTVDTLDYSWFSVYTYANIPCIIIFQCVHMLISVVFPFICVSWFPLVCVLVHGINIYFCVLQ